MDKLIDFFERYASELPLELFVFGGAFIEELISPIPSFVVLLPAGAAAEVQGQGWPYIVLLGVLAAGGRILAALLLYFLAARAERWLFSEGRHLFGYSHRQIERFGQRFSGGSRDWIIVFTLNAIPVLPTSFLSIACGFIKIRFWVFVTATYLGSVISCICYLFLGYGGIQAASALRHTNFIFQLITVLALGLLLWWLLSYRQRLRNRAEHKGIQKN